MIEDNQILKVAHDSKELIRVVCDFTSINATVLYDNTYDTYDVNLDYISIHEIIFNDEFAHKITHLSLSNCNLKTIPKNIFKLKNLKVLILSCNEISVIPKKIRSLEKLWSFNFVNNRVKKLPAELGYLPLHYIQTDNNLFRSIPIELLKLDTNYFSGNNVLLKKLDKNFVYWKSFLNLDLSKIIQDNWILLLLENPEITLSHSDFPKSFTRVDDNIANQLGGLFMKNRLSHTIISSILTINQQHAIRGKLSLSKFDDSI